MPAPTALELLYLIAIAHVWSRGSIFRPLRNLSPNFLDCPLCSGWWIGFFGHGLWFGIGTFAFARDWLTWLGTASVVGTATLALCGLIRRL